MDEQFLQRVQTFFKQDYHDRGKLKWQGFFLSDHTQRMKEHRQDRVQKNLPNQMTVDSIRQVVTRAWQQHRYLQVQLAVRDLDGQFAPLLTGLVTGFWDYGFILDKSRLEWTDIWAVLEVVA